MSVTVDRYRTAGLRHCHLKPVKVKQQRWGKRIAGGKKDKQVRDILYEGFELSAPRLICWWWSFLVLSLVARCTDTGAAQRVVRSLSHAQRISEHHE
jgi:hypothetical protein